MEESLSRLQTDWIDLYQIHRPDHSTDIEETLCALTGLVHAGKIRAFGCSTFPAEEIVGAYHVAERRGLLRFRTEQPPYSLLAGGIESSVLPVCQRLGMGVLTWSPRAWGFLSGRYRKGEDAGLSAGRPRCARIGSIPRFRRTPPSSRPPGSSRSWRRASAAPCPSLRSRSPWRIRPSPRSSLGRVP